MALGSNCRPSSKQSRLCKGRILERPYYAVGSFDECLTQQLAGVDQALPRVRRLAEVGTQDFEKYFQTSFKGPTQKSMGQGVESSQA